MYEEVRDSFKTMRGDTNNFLYGGKFTPRLSMSFILFIYFGAG